MILACQREKNYKLEVCHEEACNWSVDAYIQVGTDEKLIANFEYQIVQ